MAAQTRPPEAWVVVDDGSTDETPAILARLSEEIPFLVLCATPPPLGAAVKDRLAAAADPRAFNRGLASVAWPTFTHIAKLDGDTELPARYFEVLLSRFAQDSRLGIAGGVRTEHTVNGWRVERAPAGYHVPGALKCYTTACLQEIGGVSERLAWDTIDEVYARMRGYHTHAFGDLVAVHHRPWGSADGALRGRLRHGRCAYIAHYPWAWVAARALLPQPARPRAMSSLCFVAGYAQAAIRRTDRVDDDAFRRFMHAELRARALTVAGPRRVAARVAARDPNAGAVNGHS